MANKQTTLAAMTAEIQSGMTIGIGGWGSRRKPMALVRAILNSDVEDLTVVAYGGPDVGLLVKSGKVKKVICGFVTLDSIPLDPLWRAARQAGAVELMEVDEGLFYLGLQAAAWRVPFLVARAGLGSAVLDNAPEIRTIENPYGDGPFADPADGGATLVAMPALRLDIAAVHVNIADTAGNAMVLGPDPFFDELFLGAAQRRFVTAEKVVEAGTLSDHGPLERVIIHRLMTDAVAETPGGAHFTTNLPDYGRDEAFQKAYVAAAKEPEAWTAFSQRFLAGDEESYQQAVQAWRAEQ
ncbi:MAG: CoA-transferase [Actinomycetes bacterium]